MATEYKSIGEQYACFSKHCKEHAILYFPTKDERWWHERQKHFNELEDYVDLYMIPFTD